MRMLVKSLLTIIAITFSMGVFAQGTFVTEGRTWSGEIGTGPYRSPYIY